MKIGTCPEALQSVRSRNLIRRNYRWLRREGCSRFLARCVIESTEVAVSCDAIFARDEARRGRAA